MKGILILAHGELAQGYISALKLIYGEVRKVDFLGLFHETSIDEYRNEVAKKMIALGEEEGVLVFCDIFGASPYNVTAQNYTKLQHKINYRSITGVNLPMVIEAVSNREALCLDELAQQVQYTGKEGIKELFTIIGRDEKNG